MTLLPYAPLAGGFLSGKYQRNRPLPKNGRLAYSSHHASDVINERNWDIADRLRDFASRTNRSLLDIAFGWLLARPVTASVIAGAMTPEQIEQNVRAGRQRRLAPPRSPNVAHRGGRGGVLGGLGAGGRGRGPGSGRGEGGGGGGGGSRSMSFGGTEPGVRTESSRSAAD